MTARKKRAFRFVLYAELCLICNVGVLLLRWYLRIEHTLISEWITKITLEPGAMIALRLIPKSFDIQTSFAIGALIVNILLYGTIGYFLGYFTYKQAPGFCQNCEYNLTGNVSGICSECGQKIEVD